MGRVGGSAEDAVERIPLAALDPAGAAVPGGADGAVLLWRRAWFTPGVRSTVAVKKQGTGNREQGTEAAAGRSDSLAVPRTNLSWGARPNEPPGENKGRPKGGRSTTGLDCVGTWLS